MKTTTITKAMMAVLFAMTSVLTLNAVEPVRNKNKKAFVPTQKYVYTLDEAGKFLAWHSYKKDRTGWELDGLINEVLLAKR